MTFYPLALTQELHELPPLTLDETEGSWVCWVDADDRPLTGAWVSARGPRDTPSSIQSRMGWRPVHRRALTGPDGCTVFHRAENEILTFTLHGSAARSNVSTTEASETETPDGRKSPALKAKPGFEHTLRIVDSEGQALPGAQIWVGRRPWPAGRTDDEGRLSLYLDGSDSTPILLLTADGHQQIFDWQIGSQEPLVVTPPRTLIGRVADSAGRSLNGTMVWLDRDPGRFQILGADGSYSLTRPGTGPVTVQAENRGYLPFAVRLPRFLAPKQPAEDRQTPSPSSIDPVPALALAEEKSIAGLVVDGAGEPVIGAQVAAVHQPADGKPKALIQPDPAHGRSASAAGGSFQLPGLKASERYQLIVSLPGRPTLATFLTVPTGPRRG